MTENDTTWVPLPSDLLMAIGAYTVYFSVLDGMITKALGVLMNLSDEEMIKFGQDIQSTDTRIMLLEYVGRIFVNEEDKPYFKKSMKHIKDENSERNKIIHWVWIAESKQDSYTAKLRTAWGTKEKNYTVAELKKRSIQIHLVTNALREFIQRVQSGASQGKPPEPRG